MQVLLTRGIDEHDNLRSEETHQFKDSPLGRIPVEWEVKRIDGLAKVSYGISDAIDVMNQTGIPMITLPCVDPHGHLDVSPPTGSTPQTMSGFDSTPLSFRNGLLHAEMDDEDKGLKWRVESDE